MVTVVKIELPEVCLATLLPPASRVTGSATEVWKGFIRTHASGDIEAFIKVLPAQQIVSEVAASLLGRALKLPIPTPYLVRVTKSSLPLSNVWNNVFNDVIAFATEQAPGSQFYRYIEAGSVGMERLRKWHMFKKTALFDEWIANGDRHRGNILFNGVDKFWLIDHSHAFTSESWQPQTLNSDALVRNQLIDDMKLTDMGEKHLWIESANDESKLYVAIESNSLGVSGHMSSYASDKYIESATTFVEQRAYKVASLVKRRLGLEELSYGQ